MASSVSSGQARVDDLCEEYWIDHALAPLVIVSRGRLAGDDFLDWAPFALQSRDVVSHRHEHVAVLDQLAAAARSAMPRHDQRSSGHLRDTLVRCANGPVDAFAMALVDERVNAIPPDIAERQDVGLREVDREIIET
jgi:hypothetical protein